MPDTLSQLRRMARHPRICWVLLTGLGAAFGAAAGPAYSPPQVFSRPGAITTQLWDIGGQGQLVGQSADDVRAEGFVFANGSFTTIMPGWASGSAATGISDSGVIVGTYFTDDPNAPTFQSFLYENGVYSDFSLPGTTDLILRRISANGRFMTGSYVDGSNLTRGFVYDRQSGTATVILQAANAFAIVQGVTSQGLAVGSVAGPNTFAFSFDVISGVLTPYADADLGARPRFRDINDSGLITGFSGTQAFVGTPGNWTFFDPPPGMGSAWGYGLNNQGDLIGNYSGANGEVQAFVSTPVPEPAAWALLAGGLALLAWRRRPSA